MNLWLAKRRHTKQTVPLNPAAYLPTPAFLWTKGGFFDESVPTYPCLYGGHAVGRYLPRIYVAYKKPFSPEVFLLRPHFLLWLVVAVRLHSYKHLASQQVDIVAVARTGHT